MMHEAVFLDKICIISLLQFSVTYVVLVAQELLCLCLVMYHFVTWP